MKRIIWILLIAVAVTTAAVASLVAAYMFRTASLTNTLKPGNVACEVEEVTVKSDVARALTKQEITVKNTGNTQAYIRVKVITYWQDSKGNIVGRDTDTDDLIGKDKINGDAWLRSEIVSDDVKSITYYCKTPIDPEASTPDLLKDGQTIVLNSKDVTYEGVTYTYHLVAEVIAEAIQSKPTSAVVNSWGVTVDGAGNITNVVVTN